MLTSSIMVSLSQYIYACQIVMFYTLFKLIQCYMTIPQKKKTNQVLHLKYI